MPRTILVADDSSTIRRVVEHTFAGTDITVLTAVDGESALDIARRERPDLVLCDVLMPGLSGYDVAQQLHREPGCAALPILLLTGAFEPFDESRAKECGALGYIAKPFESAVLRQRVQVVLSQNPEPSRSSRPAPVLPPSVPPPPAPAQKPLDPLDDADALMRRWGLEPSGEVAPPPPEEPEDRFGRYLDEALRPAHAPAPAAPPATAGPQPWRAPHVALPGDEDFDLGRVPSPVPPARTPAAPVPQAPPPQQAPPAVIEPAPEPPVVTPVPSAVAAPPPEPVAPAAPAATTAPGLPEVGPSTLEEIVRGEVRRQIALLAPEALREVAWEVVPDLLERILKAAAEGRPPSRRED